jgi:hypothetical protein
MARSVSYPSDAVVAFDDWNCRDEYDWDFQIEDLQWRLKQAYPSLSECDKWLGREDQAIMENGHAYFGVSEYCGLVSIWVVPKDSSCDQYGELSGIGANWVRQIADGFQKRFGSLVKIGRFSNGESIYERKAA